jgi:hypothetical protein
MTVLSASLAVFGCAFGKGRARGLIGPVKGAVWTAVFVGYLILLFVQEHT